MLTEHSAPPTAAAPAVEINPIDPRLPPEAPMLMPAQEIRARDGLPAWLRAFRPSSGQAG